MDVPNEVLRPGLEAAVIVAALGSRQRPPIPSPAGLRPFLRFQKLPNAALAPVRKVLEEDEAFRARVASVATEETVNPASLLWLHRPAGWEDDLAELVEGEGASDTTPAAAKALAGRLEAAEAKARRLSAEVATLRGAVARAQDGRERAEADAVKARARVDELERAGARAKTRSDQAAADAAVARLAADEAVAEVAQLRRALEDQREDHARRAIDPPEPLAAREDPPAPAAPAPLAAPAALPERAVEAVGAAATAAAALAASLQDLASSLAWPPAADPAAPGPGSAGSGTTPAAIPARPAEVVAPRSPRRRALRIPRGMHVGTAEADAWLLTEAHAAVVVDGYNVAKLGWPDAALPDQRERLLDVLDDLACRHSTAVEVVFDGADVGPVRPTRRRRVGVRFSPPSVLADDVIRDLVASHPSTDPIIVVTNDRAVAHDVRAAGANVVTSDGLLAIARR